MNDYTEEKCSCIGEVREPLDRTLKDNLDNTIDTLKNSNDLMNQFINFVWAEEAPTNNGIDIKGFDSALVCAKDESKILFEKIIMVTQRFGLN